jgi:hypothetical protein
MDPIVAEYFYLIDGAFGSISTSLEVNGVLVPPVPNFVNSPSVTISVVGSNISFTAVAGASAWATLTGVLSNGQVIPWADAGISRLGADALAIGNGVAGDFSGSLKLTGISIQGALTDSFASVGALGQVLSSTVTGLKWITPTSGSGFPTRFVTVAAPYTAVAGDFVLCDTSGGGFTVTIPLSAANALSNICVKKISSDQNVLTIAASGADNIDFQSSWITTQRGTAVLMTATGTTSWEIY